MGKPSAVQLSAPVRKAVAHALLEPELNGVLCTFDQLITPLSSIGDVANDAVAVINHTLIQRAFRQFSGGEDLCVPYSDPRLKIDIEDADRHFLLVRNAKRVGRVTVYEFCHLNDGDHHKFPPSVIPSDEDYEDTQNNHPLNKPSLKRNLGRLVPGEVKADLKSYLMSQKKVEKVKFEYAKTKKVSRAESKSMKSKKKQQQKTKRGASEKEDNDDDERDSIDGKRAKTRKGTWPPPLKKLSHEMLALKMKIIEDAVRLEEMKTQLNAMVAELGAEQGAEKENLPPPSQPTVDVEQNTIEDEDAVKLFYTINGRAGKVNAKQGGIIFVNDLEKELEPLTPEMSGESAEQIRKRRNTHLARYGKSHAWIPAGTVLIAKDYLSKLEKSATIVKKLKDLFGAEKCVFSRESLARLAAWNLHNYGGSDEATEMAIAGTLDALFNEIGFDCSSDQLGKSCPSQRTIARYELNLAVDCLMKVLQEIKDDGAKCVGIMTDHGHRGKQDHFVIVVVWSGYDSDGNRTLKTFCPSIDSAGHTAVEAANAVKAVMERFLGNGEIEIHCALGDAGGGAAIRNLYPKLLELEVMGPDSKFSNCSLHGKQKALQNASTETMGDQGLGVRSPWQMVYSFANLMKLLRKEDGIGLLDTFWSIVQDEIRDNPEWESIAEDKFKQAWRDFITKIESFDELSDDGIDALIKFMTESPRDIQDPIWTRWGTIIQTTGIFIDNYVTIYFLCVGVRGHFDSKKHVWKLACTLLSLMNERAEPDLDSGESHEHFVESFTEENAGARGCDTFVKPGDSPTFLTMLLFHRGFCEYVFNDNFSFLLRNDPYFGAGTFGQLARFMTERCYIMHKQISELKDGGWRSIPQFRPFVEALKGVPKRSQHKADLQFFESLPEKFIKVYESNLHKHILDRWRNDKLVMYQLAGQPELAKEFAASLVHHRENVMGAINDEGDAINAEDLPKYQFPDETITMDEIHKLTQGSIEVNVKECLEFVTKKADMDKVVKDKLIEKHWDLILSLASNEETVRLFDKLENGKVDKTTWNGIDYDPLVEDIWRLVAIHSHHQQRCENYVQMAAIISKTLVEEARRTWRAICNSTIIRPFNMQAVEELRKKVDDEATKKKIKRVSGRKRIKAFREFLNEFRAKVWIARASVDEEKYKAIYNSIAKKTNKMSTKEREELTDGFSKSVKKKVKSYKADQVTGFELTALMGGKVKLAALKKSDGHEPLVDEELLARKITTEMEEFIAEYGENADIGTVPYLEKKAYLKLHESKREVSKNEKLTLEDAKKKTTAILPASDGLVAFLMAQHQIVGTTAETAE